MGFLTQRLGMLVAIALLGAGVGGFSYLVGRLSGAEHDRTLSVAGALGALTFGLVAAGTLWVSLVRTRIGRMVLATAGVTAAYAVARWQDLRLYATEDLVLNVALAYGAAWLGTSAVLVFASWVIDGDVGRLWGASARKR